MGHVVVVGAGIAGLSSALALGRAGHTVTVCDRDPSTPPACAADAFAAWPRKGVGQFYHPHTFLGRARELLRERLPDVYDELLACGARELDFSPRIPASEPAPGDERMKTLACRRALFEWVLRRAVEREGRARILQGAAVEGLIAARPSPPDPPRITAAYIAGHGIVEADLVIDASGQCSQLERWLTSAAGVTLLEEAHPCEALYYSRHYALRPGEARPQGEWLVGPSAELGFLRFALDEGDSGTFAVTIRACPSEGRLRAIRHEAVWNALVRAFPEFGPWLERAAPLTDVLPMGSLRNVLRQLVVDGRPLAVGVLAIGDALCRTNPQHAWGGSLAVHHALAAADAFTAHPADPVAQALAFHAATGDDAARRFRSSAGEDRARRRWNEGAPIDPRSPADDARLFVRHVVYPASFGDPILFRAVARRVNMIDPPDVLETDRALHERALAAYARRYPDGPTWTLGRDEVLALVDDASADAGVSAAT